MLGVGLGSQPTTESGIFGSYQSLNLDGNSDYVSTPSELYARTWASGTASCWVNLIQNDGDTSQHIFQVYGDANNAISLQYQKYYTEWRANFRGSGTTKVAAYDIPSSSIDDGSGFDDGWQHFAMTWGANDGYASGPGVTIYRNGTQAGTTSTSGVSWNAAVNGSSLHIGANKDGDGAFVDGQIDQVAIYSTQLTSDNIAAIYNGGVMRDLTMEYINYPEDAQDIELLAYYQFEGKIIDSSVNSYDGTLNGTAGFSTNQP